jgi:hypothetical protein
MNRRILFSRVFVMFFSCHELIIGCVYHSHTPESRLHLKYCFTKEILWSKIGYWFMYINDLCFLVLMSTWQILTPTTFPLKKRTGEWSQNGEKAVLSPPYNTRWQLRHGGGGCARLRGAAAHRASVQVTSAEAVEAAEAGDFLVENASVSQPSCGQEIQSLSSWLCSFQSPSLYDLLFCDHEK